MRKNHAFPKKYLKVEDFENGPVSVTIGAVKFEEVAEGQRKPVIYFDEPVKPLVVNSTNWDRIGKIAGSDDSDDWEGHKITIQPDLTTYRGETVNCIRVAVAAAGKKPRLPSRKSSTDGL